MFKRRAVKPISKIERYLRYGFVIMEYECHYCPRCGSVLNAGPNYQPKYCDQCGQKVNFKGIEWREEKMLGYEKGRINFEKIEDRVV